MDDFQSTQMDNSWLPGRTFPITYSQGDLVKFPSRNNLGIALKPISTKDLGKLRCNTGIAPLKHIGIVETIIMLL